MKIRLLIIISIIIVFVLISFAMPNLSKVYGSCEMIRDGILQPSIGYGWTNGLLSINNAECTWKLFGVIPIVNLLLEEKTFAENTSEHTVYSRPFGMNQQDVGFTVEPQYVKNPPSSNEMILDLDAMKQIKKIFDKCDYAQKLGSGEIPAQNSDGSRNVINDDLLSYNNGTHYISNNTCKWIDSLEALTYNCFEANSVEQNSYMGPDYFGNQTHHIDAQECMWIKK